MTSSFKQMAGVVLASLLWFTGTASAVPADAQSALKNVRTPELPAKAAKLLEEAALTDRPARAVEVLSAAMEISPASSAAVVGAMSRKSPDQAALLAGTAAAWNPKQAAAFARAAASGAPSRISEIVAAVVTAVPSEYARVAVAVLRGLPGKDAEVIAGLKSLQNINGFLDHLAQTANEPLNGLAVVQATTEWVKQASRSLGMKPDEFVAAELTPSQITAASSVGLSSFSFVIGPPFTPAPNNPGEISSADTLEVPPGQGRDYSKP